MQTPEPPALSAGARRRPALRRAWCCSFGVVPPSPDHHQHHHKIQQQKPEPCHRKPPAPASFHSSPSPSSKLARNLIDPRRILSPGRVSPIDSDAAAAATLQPPADAASVATSATVAEEEEDVEGEKEDAAAVAQNGKVESFGVGEKEGGFDLRLFLKGKDGRCFVLELDSEVLCENSPFFSELVAGSRGKSSDGGCSKIEVANVADLGAFKETIELMHKEDLTRWLIKAGVSRAIDVLEVSTSITFNRGIMSCLKYLEAVPWSENEEEKLKNLLTRCTFHDAIVHDLLSRLYPPQDVQSKNLALQLVQSVASGKNASAKKEMQSLVNGLLSNSSVYEKDPAGLDKEGLYGICHSCLNALVELFREASDSVSREQTLAADGDDRPLIERMSKQVDSLNWILEILIEKQMAEDFVCLWANHGELLAMHETTSPMVRYELSRISASVFIALGRGRLQCCGDVRHRVLSSWLRPMFLDFGWLQRCSKGLDMRMLEEALGQALLTLSLKQQESLFVEWFRCFAGKGTECPNLSRAFQVWWRRSFVRTAESNTQPSCIQNMLYEL